MYKIDTFISHGTPYGLVDGWESTVSKQGVTIKRSLAHDERIGPTVEFAIVSDHDMPIAVRICDTLPVEHDVTKLRFHTKDGRWRALENDRLEFSAVLEPFGSISTRYSRRKDNRDELVLRDAPSIEAIQPVEPTALDREEPLRWRSVASTAIVEETDDDRSEERNRAQRTIGSEDRAANGVDGTHSTAPTNSRYGRASSGGSSDPLDIAFVSNVVYPFVRGGAEKRIHEIGTRLAERGHDVTVYCRHFWDGPRTISHRGMTLRAVGPDRSLYVDGRRSIAEAIEFAVEVPYPLYRHGQEHDVIVASVFPYFPVFAAKMSAIPLHTPLVTTWHEVWGPYWDEYLGIKAPFGKLVERLAAKVPQYPIAVSERTADALAAIGPSRDHIQVVPNGVDVDRIRSIPPSENGFDVLFAGRLIENKNVDLLLSAFDQLAEEHDVTLGIIGDGPELAALRAQARRLSCSDHITFLGFLEEYDDVLAHMRTADVFISPSTREGFGITFVEAMAADCAVIAADHPDSAAREVIGDEGYLVELSVSEITTALDRVLSGHESATNKNPMAAALRYDWNRVTNQAIAAYRAAMQEEHPAIKVID